MTLSKAREVFSRLTKNHPLTSAGVSIDDVILFLIIKEAVEQVEAEEEERLHDSLMEDIHDHYGDE